MNKITVLRKLSQLKSELSHYGVTKLGLFGSTVRGENTEHSDIDLLIEFEPDISIEEYTDNYFSLREKLVELFKRKIDLVTQRSLSNPFFIADIEQSKKLIYGA